MQAGSPDRRPPRRDVARDIALSRAARATPLRIGIAGAGAAGRAFIPALQAHGGMRLTALAEPVAATRGELAAQHGLAAFASLEAMLDGVGLDAVYIATPTEMHLLHVRQACAAGKHVLVEKPMAANLEDARAMIAAADAAGVVLMVGHSHSYDLPIRRMRELIAGGTLGRVRMVNTWCYSDWVHRPRRPEEFDVDRGGGVTFRQGSHQFDILRLLCGGLARSVRARTFDWDPDRSTIGAHVAFVDFADGAAATAVYNGYGRFSTMDLTGDISEWGFHQPPAARPPVRRVRAGAAADDEWKAKAARARTAIPAQAPFQPAFGLTLVSCEGGDIRQSPTGIIVYSDAGVSEIALAATTSPRDLVVAEFHDTVTGIARGLHDGRWGLANLELCVAAMASSASGREIALAEQVAVLP